MIKKLKKKLYAVFFWQTSFGEILNKIYDLNIFYSNYFTEKKLNNKENYRAYLTKQYHIIEKGMALPEPRKGFGIPKIKSLIKIASEYQKKFGEDDLTKNIKEALNQYRERNVFLKDTNTGFYNLLANYISKIETKNSGGVKHVKLEEVKKAIDIDFETFAKTRTSVRNFSSIDVLDNDVIKAIEVAKYTPSVCNRQSWQVHYFKDRKTIDQLLNLQNGNNGFTHSINKLIVVTTDVLKFTKLESNQIFIDGGLFSMNLLLSLHAQGIASCCLNTCLPYVDEIKIKELGSIPKSERLIMMIGIGMYKESYEVAISGRVAVEQIINIK